MISFLRKKYVLSAVIILFAIACLSVFCIKLGTITHDSADTVYGVDFIAYYTAARLIESGDIHEIYPDIADDFSAVDQGTFYETAKKAGFPLTPTRYVYLPLFLAPFTLFTAFSYLTAATLWLILNLCAVIVIIILQWSLTHDLPHPLLRFLAIISLNLCSFPLLYALKLGQTSIMVYLLVCLIFYCTLKKKDYLAGIFLGVIITLKYSPLLFLLYFLYRKRYTLVISSAVTTGSLFLLSLLIYGLPLHEQYWDYLSEFSGIRIAAWSNQSIDAFALRLAVKTSIFSFAPLPAAPFISLISYATTLLVVGIVYFFISRNKGEKDIKDYSLEFSAVVLCFLLISPISWLHYFSMTALPVILITSFCWHRYPSLLKLVGPLVAMSYSMIVFHPNYTSLIASSGQGFFTRAVVSFPFLGTCSLLFINLLLMKKAKNLP